MKNSKFVVSIVVFLVALVSTAAAPVAMRVEVKPLGSTGEETRVAVIVQVSPEDRGRIGKNPIVRIELDGEVPPGQSPMWAARMEDDGSTRVETMWPPGEHDLKVEIEDPSGEHRGLWVGRVRVPGDQPEPTPVLPTPTPSPLPTPPPMPTPTAAVPTPVPETETVVEPEAVAVAAGVASAADPTEPPPFVSSETERPAPAPTVEPEIEPVVAAATTSESPPDAAQLPEPDVDIEVESVEVSASAEPEEEAPTPEEDGGTNSAAPVVAAAAAGGASTTEREPADEAVSEESTTPVEQPIVEPLRSSEPPSPTTEPLRGESQPVAASGVPAESVKGAAPETLSAIDAWQDAAPGTVDLTVIVSRNRQPVSGLQSGNLSLEIDGAAVPIEKVGDAENAPLLLGFAVDLSPSGISNWPQVSRMLGPLVQRAGGGLGRLFAVGGNEATDWDAAPGRLDELLPNPSGGDLTGLIDRALERLGEERGRTFLVLITDGRTNPTKEAWKQTGERIAEAGVPVLVIALWDENFSNKVRKGLQQLSAASGGRLFQVLGVDQLDGAVDRYGPVLDSGVALRFRPPERSKTGPAQVAVKAGDRSLDVTAPKSIR